MRDNDTNVALGRDVCDYVIYCQLTACIDTESNRRFTSRQLNKIVW